MPAIALAYVGIISLSVTVSYAFWVKVRVIRLQQDIYDVRDRLFDCAQSVGRLDDPAYRETRDLLNRLVWASKFLSVPLMAYLVATGDGEREAFRPVTSDPGLQDMIDRSTRQVARRMFRYLQRETISGILIGVVIEMPFILARHADTEIDRKGLELVEIGIRSASMASVVPRDYCPAGMAA